MTDPPRPHRVLRQHVQTDQFLGVDAVPMGKIVSGSDQTDVNMEVPVGESHFGTNASKSFVRLDRGTKLKVLQDMDASEVQGCTKCSLCESRTQTVFGEGDPDAKLMFIGEGPGWSEDEQGRPFVGRSGEMLNKMIVAMGLAREQVYIANVVKCRPPENRTPTPLEVATCWDYLRRQIATIQPGVIVTLGGPATKMVLETNKGITSLRGTWHRYNGLIPDGPAIPVMPTFHPAYLLRSYTSENRGKVWSDLQEVIKRLASG